MNEKKDQRPTHWLITTIMNVSSMKSIRKKKTNQTKLIEKLSIQKIFN